MTRLEWKPAHTLDDAARAALFELGYVGYAVPMSMDASTHRFIVDAFDLDLAASRIGFADASPRAFAYLGVRGQRGWIGGLGVVEDARGQGFGREGMEVVLDAGRALGLRDVRLEVIVGNDTARRLYESLGFRPTRELEVWSLPADASARAETRPCSLGEGMDRIDAVRDEPEPWQRERRTLERIGDGLHALALDRPPATGAIVWRDGPGRAGVLQLAAAGGEDAHVALLSGLRAARPEAAIRMLNAPAGGPVAAAFESLGGTRELRQQEMRLELSD